MTHLTKDKPYPWHKLEAKEDKEWFCQECHCRITKTSQEYGHGQDCSHRPEHFRETWN